MNRVLFAPQEIGRPLALTDHRAQHMLRILKLQPGNSVQVGVIEAGVGHATVRSIDDREITLDFELNDDPPPALLPITCLLGHPRPIVLKRILRDLSAVGVARVVVCATELGERSYLCSKLWQAESWRRYLIEGAEQAGATALPQVYRARSVAHGLELLDQFGGAAPRTRLFFDEAVSSTAGTGFSYAARVEAPLVYAVGSERGWTAAERALFHKRSWLSVGLGPRVLRVETAAVAAAVMCASALAG